MNFATKAEVFQYFKEETDKAIEYFKGEMSVIRAGRANPKVLDKVLIDYYGTPTPLYQMANITVPEPRMLLVNVWDMSMVKEVVKTINEANLGLNPSDDGKSIRLVFPTLTEERRKELSKSIKKIAEDSKVTLRNERRDALDELKEMKKENIITEDELEGAEKEVQRILNQASDRIDELLAVKEKEIMEV